MMTLDDLFDLAERGNVLVFPTEESARGFSVRYAEERRKGIKASSAIAFDTFASSFLAHGASAEPASEIDRLIFSSYAAERLSDRFRYFSSSAYPEVRERLASYIRSMLPHLPDARSMGKRSRNAESDLKLIEHEYMAFLSSMGLYEPSFEDIVVPDLDTDHYLVMPSAFPKEERIATALEGQSRVHRIEGEGRTDLCLTRYESEKEEIRALFCHIRSLLDKGVPYSDIVITTAAEDRLRMRIEEEAYLFGIPVVFASGESPLSSASGAFLSSLSDIHSSSYSLDSLKSFFLNPAIPFQDPEALLRFVEAAISNSITSAPSFSRDRYMKIPASEGGGWYRALRFTLDKLMAEKDSDVVLQHIHALMAALLVPEEFSGREDDAAVYSFAMHELGAFLDKARRAKAAGYPVDKPLFPLFIPYLAGERYVPRKKEGGIRIYPFTQDAALSARYRFIIALNDDESTVRVRKARFLSDYELSEERKDTDITRDVLESYALFSGNLFLSASSQTYSGFALPLSSIASADGYAAPDAWRKEREHGDADRIFPLQREGYGNALRSSLRPRDMGEDFTYGRPGGKEDGKISLSFSAYSAYSRCPFIYALKYVFGLDSVPSFVPATLDAAEMGTRLHKVLERYYRGDGDIPYLFDEEMEAWKNGEGLMSFQPRATDLQIANIKAVYLDNLIAIASGMDGMSESVDGGLELWLMRDVDDRLALKGKIDRLASAPDGKGLIIFDYKSRGSFSKAELEKQGFQMYIYKLLVERSYPEREVESAYFVTLRDGSIGAFPFVLSSDEVLDDLRRAAEGIAAGDWHALPSDENCEGCAYRSICRRRFVVR